MCSTIHRTELIRVSVRVSRRGSAAAAAASRTAARGASTSAATETPASSHNPRPPPNQLKMKIDAIMLRKTVGQINSGNWQVLFPFPFGHLEASLTTGFNFVLLFFIGLNFVSLVILHL